MNRIAFIAVVVVAWIGAAARTVYSVQPVADVELSGRVWNLTECEPVGSEVDYRVDEGVPVRVWSPDTRFDFTVTGDSVIHLATETRAYRALFSPGIIRQYPDRGGMSQFAVRGRIRQAQYIAGTGVAVVDEPRRGLAVVAAGDTIGGALLHHDVVTMRWTVVNDSLSVIDELPDSLLATTVIESYRLMAPGEAFPRAVKRVERHVEGGREVACDSSAWVLSYNPGIETERANRAVRNRRPDGTWPGGDGGIDDLDDGIGIKVGSDGAVVTARHNVAAKVVITDVIGRMYYEADMTLTPDGAQVATDGLPRGEYLLQVIPTDGTPTVAVKLTR